MTSTLRRWPQIACVAVLAGLPVGAWPASSINTDQLIAILQHAESKREADAKLASRLAELEPLALLEQSRIASVAAPLGPRSRTALDLLVERSVFAESGIPVVDQPRLCCK